MSLLDALLLDPFRDPREIYIALRTDGQTGSGTLQDPYDGDTRFGAALAGSITCNLREFVVNARTPFVGLAVGATVNITGCCGPSAHWNFDGQTGPFNGAFTVAEILQTQLNPLGQSGAMRFTLLFRIGDALPPTPPATQYGYRPQILLSYGNGGGGPINIFWPVAKVTTSTPQTFVSFEGVAIDQLDATGPVELSGNYPILGPRMEDKSFRYRLSFKPGADITTPVSCRVRCLIYRFDEVMRSVLPYSIIHLGPGTFETRGYTVLWLKYPYGFFDISIGFELQSGQRLIGSGIDVSVLRLVLPIDETIAHIVVGSEGADYAEVADLTVDCNGPGHATPFGLLSAPVTCGAVTINGSFNRVRRMRVVNHFVQAAPECFAIFLSKSRDPFAFTPIFGVIDDCILEKPSENNTHETTLASLAGDNVTSRGRSLILRNTYHNSEYSNGFTNHPIPLQILTSESKVIGGGATVYFGVLTTTRPHSHVKGKALVVKGVKVGSALSTIYNGNFAIEEIVSDTILKYRLYGPPEIGTVDIGGAFIGSALSSETLALGPLSDPTGETFTITTKRPHNRVPGQTVIITNVYPDPPSGVLPIYFGPFKVTNVTPPYGITCEILNPPSPFTPGYTINSALLGANFFGRGAMSGTGCLTQGNSFYNGTNAIYHDTGSTHDVMVRHNYYSNFERGLYINLAPGSTDSFQSSAAIVPYKVPSDPNSYGLFTVIQPDLPIPNSPGSTVTIREAGNPTPDPLNPFHGAGLIVLYPRPAGIGSNQFVYRLMGGLPTINCPGRPVFNPEILLITSGTSANYDATAKVTTVTTNVTHGLVNGDFVTLFGILAGMDLSPLNDFAGPITVLSTTSFSFVREFCIGSLSGTNGSLDRHVGTGMTRNGSKVTVNTVFPRGYIIGQSMLIQKAYINSQTDNRYNGLFQINAVTERSFSYDMKPGKEPEASLALSPTGEAEYASHWDFQRLYVENNIYDLYPLDGNSASAPQGATIAYLNPLDTPPYLVSTFVFRDNLVRHADNVPSNSLEGSVALLNYTLGNVTVEENSFAVGNAHPLKYSDCGFLTHMQNDNGNGTPVRGYDLPAGRLLGDVESRIAESLIMALL